MSKTKNSNAAQPTPMLMPPDLMSKICGIGENRLRALMDAGELEYLPVGNRRLLCAQAIWDYYQRKKVSACNI